MRLRLDDIAEGTEVLQPDGYLVVPVIPAMPAEVRAHAKLVLSPLVPAAMQSLLPVAQVIGSARLPALAGRDCPPDCRLHIVSEEAGETTLGWPLQLVHAQVRPEGRVDASRVDAGRVDVGRVDAGRVDAGRVDAGRVERASTDTRGAERASTDAASVVAAGADVIEERLIAVYQFLRYTAAAMVQGPSLAAHREQLAAFLRSGRPVWQDPDSGVVTALWDIWQ